MPNIKIQMFPGRSDELKKELADAITNDVTRILGVKEKSISIVFEDVAQSDWDNVVYSEIINDKEKLYKKPGYGTLAE